MKFWYRKLYGNFVEQSTFGNVSESGKYLMEQRTQKNNYNRYEKKRKAIFDNDSTRHVCGSNHGGERIIPS